MTGGADNAVKQWIFDNRDGSARLLKFRAGHSAPPTHVAFYGEGTRLLSAGNDRAPRLLGDPGSAEPRVVAVSRRAPRQAPETRGTGAETPPDHRHGVVRDARTRLGQRRDVSRGRTPRVHVAARRRRVGRTRPRAARASGETASPTPGKTRCCASPSARAATSPSSAPRAVMCTGTTCRVGRTGVRFVVSQGDGGGALRENRRGEKTQAATQLSRRREIHLEHGGPVPRRGRGGRGGAASPRARRRGDRGGDGRREQDARHRRRRWFRSGVAIQRYHSRVRDGHGGAQTKMKAHKPSGLVAVAGSDRCVRVLDTVGARRVEPSRRKIGRRVSRFLRRRAVGTRRDARRRGVRVGRPRGETPADHASVQRVTRRRALALPEHGRARHRARGTKGRVPVGEQSDVRAGRVGGFRESRRRRGERDGRGGGGGGRTSETSRGRERGGGDCARRARAETGGGGGDGGEGAKSDDAAGAKSDRAVAAEPAAPGLATMALLPRTQWMGLLNLETIRERNKPVAPPEKPEAAPFFLPTSRGSNAKVFDVSRENADDDEDAVPGSKILTTSVANGGDVEGTFLRLIRRGKAAAEAAEDQQLRSPVNPAVGRQSPSSSLRARTANRTARRSAGRTQTCLRTFARRVRARSTPKFARLDRGTRRR